MKNEVHYCDATGSSFVTGQQGVFTHSDTVTVKHYSSMLKFLAKNLLGVKENDEHVTDFALHLFHSFRSVELGHFHSNTHV